VLLGHGTRQSAIEDADQDGLFLFRFLRHGRY
jgi:hypothetical protein